MGVIYNTSNTNNLVIESFCPGEGYLILAGREGRTSGTQKICCSFNIEITEDGSCCLVMKEDGSQKVGINIGKNCIELDKMFVYENEQKGNALLIYKNSNDNSIHLTGLCCIAHTTFDYIDGHITYFSSYQMFDKKTVGNVIALGPNTVAYDDENGEVNIICFLGQLGTGLQPFARLKEFNISNNIHCKSLGVSGVSFQPQTVNKQNFIQVVLDINFNETKDKLYLAMNDIGMFSPQFGIESTGLLYRVRKQNGTLEFASLMAGIENFFKSGTLESNKQPKRHC